MWETIANRQPGYAVQRIDNLLMVQRHCGAICTDLYWFVLIRKKSWDGLCFQEWIENFSNSTSTRSNISLCFFVLCVTHISMSIQYLCIFASYKLFFLFMCDSTKIKHKGKALYKYCILLYRKFIVTLSVILNNLCRDFIKITLRELIYYISQIFGGCISVGD